MFWHAKRKKTCDQNKCIIHIQCRYECFDGCQKFSTENASQWVIRHMQWNYVLVQQIIVRFWLNSKQFKPKVCCKTMLMRIAHRHYYHYDMITHIYIPCYHPNRQHWLYSLTLHPLYVVQLWSAHTHTHTSHRSKLNCIFQKLNCSKSPHMPWITFFFALRNHYASWRFASIHFTTTTKCLLFLFPFSLVHLYNYKKMQEK